MKTHTSNFSIGLLGFVAGIAFLISCGSDDTVSNSNAAEPPNAVVLKDANGIYVGRVIGMTNINRSFVLTDHGYRTDMDITFGRVEESQVLQYESNDCTGAAYLDPGIRTAGNVFIHRAPSESAYNAGLILYTPLDAVSVTVTINSQLMSDLTCNTLAFPYTNDLYPALPNEPNITGIQNTAYSSPLRIE